MLSNVVCIGRSKSTHSVENLAQVLDRQLAGRRLTGARRKRQRRSKDSTEDSTEDAESAHRHADDRDW